MDRSVAGRGIAAEKAIRLKGAVAKKTIDALEQELLKGDLLFAEEPKASRSQPPAPSPTVPNAQHLTILDIAQLRAEEQAIAAIDEVKRLEQEDADRIEMLRQRRKVNGKIHRSSVGTGTGVVSPSPINDAFSAENDPPPPLDNESHTNFIRKCTLFEGSIEASRALLNRLDALLLEHKHKGEEKRLAKLAALQRIREHYHEEEPEQLTNTSAASQATNTTQEPRRKRRKNKGQTDVRPRIPTIMDAIIKGLTSEMPIPLPEEQEAPSLEQEPQEAEDISEEDNATDDGDEEGQVTRDKQSSPPPPNPTTKAPPVAPIEPLDDDEDDDFTYMQWVEHMRAHGRYTALDAEIDEAAEALISERERLESINLLKKGMMGRADIEYQPLPATVGRRTHHTGLGGSSRLGNAVMRSLGGGMGTGVDPLTAVLKERSQRHGNHTDAIARSMLRDTSNYAAILQTLKQEAEQLMGRGYVGAQSQEELRQQKKADRKRRRQLEKKDEAAFALQQNANHAVQLPPLSSIISGDQSTRTGVTQHTNPADASDMDSDTISTTSSSSYVSTEDGSEGSQRRTIPLTEAERKERAAKRQRQLTSWLVGGQAMALGRDGDTALRSIQEASKRARNEIEKRNARNRLTIESWTQTLPPQAIAKPLDEDDAAKRRRLRKAAEAKARLISAHTAAVAAGETAHVRAALAKTKDLPAHQRLKARQQLQGDTKGKSTEAWQLMGSPAEVEAFMASTNINASVNSVGVAALLAEGDSMTPLPAAATQQDQQGSSSTSITSILVAQLAKILHELQQLPEKEVAMAFEDLTLEEQILVYRHKTKEQSIHLGLQKQRINELEGFLANSYKRLQMLSASANVAGRSMASDVNRLTALTSKAMSQNERLWKRIENLIFVARAAARGAAIRNGSNPNVGGDDDLLMSGYGTSFTKTLQKSRRKAAVLHDLLAKKEAECHTLQEDYHQLERAYVLLFVSSGGDAGAIDGITMDPSLAVRPKINSKVLSELKRLQEQSSAITRQATNESEYSPSTVISDPPGGKAFALLREVMRMPLSFAAVPKEGCGLKGDNAETSKAEGLSKREVCIQRQVKRNVAGDLSDDDDAPADAEAMAVDSAPYSRVGLRESFIGLAERHFGGADAAAAALMAIVVSAMEAYHGRDYGKCAAYLSTFREALMESMRGTLSSALSEAASFTNNEVVNKIVWDFETQLIQQKYSFLEAIATLQASGADAAEEIQRKVQSSLMNHKKAAAREAATMLHKEKGERQAAEEARLAALLRYSNLSAETFFDIEKKTCLSMGPISLLTDGIRASVNERDVEAVRDYITGRDKDAANPTPPPAPQVSPRSLSSQQSQRLALSPRAIAVDTPKDALGLSRPLPYLFHPHHPQDLLRLVIGFLCELTLESVGYFISVANEDLLKQAEGRLAPPKASNEGQDIVVEDPLHARPSPSSLRTCAAALIPIQRLHQVGYYLDALEGLMHTVGSREGLIDGLTDKDLGYTPSIGGGTSPQIAALTAPSAGSNSSQQDWDASAIAKLWWTSASSRRPQMPKPLPSSGSIDEPPTDREALMVGLLAEGLLDRRLVRMRVAKAEGPPKIISGADDTKGTELVSSRPPSPELVDLPLRPPQGFLTDHHYRQYHALLAVLTEGLATDEGGPNTRLVDTYRKARERNQLRLQRMAANSSPTTSKAKKKMASSGRIGSISMNTYGTGDGDTSPRDRSPKRKGSMAKLRRAASKNSFYRSGDNSDGSTRYGKGAHEEHGMGRGPLASKSTMGPMEFSGHGRGVVKRPSPHQQHYSETYPSADSASSSSGEEGYNTAGGKPRGGRRGKEQYEDRKRRGGKVPKVYHSIGGLASYSYNPYSGLGDNGDTSNPHLSATEALEGRSFDVKQKGHMGKMQHRNRAQDLPEASRSAPQNWNTLGLNKTVEGDIGSSGAKMHQQEGQSLSAFHRRQLYHDALVNAGISSSPKRSNKEGSKRVRIVYEEFSSSASSGSESGGAAGERASRKANKGRKVTRQRILYQDFFGYRSYTNPADDPRRGSVGQQQQQGQFPTTVDNNATSPSKPHENNMSMSRSTRQASGPTYSQNNHDSAAEEAASRAELSVAQSKPYQRLRIQREVLSRALEEVSGKCERLVAGAEGLRSENAALRRRLRELTGEDEEFDDYPVGTEVRHYFGNGMEQLYGGGPKLAPHSQLSSALHSKSGRPTNAASVTTVLPPLHQQRPQASTQASASIDKRFPLLQLPVLLNPMTGDGSPDAASIGPHSVGPHSTAASHRPVDRFLSFGGKKKPAVSLSQATQPKDDSDDEYHYVDLDTLLHKQLHPPQSHTHVEEASPTRRHHLAPLLGNHSPQQAHPTQLPPMRSGMPLMPLGSALSQQYRVHLEHQRAALVGRLLAEQQRDVPPQK